MYCKLKVSLGRPTLQIPGTVKAQSTKTREYHLWFSLQSDLCAIPTAEFQRLLTCPCLSGFNFLIVECDNWDLQGQSKLHA